MQATLKGIVEGEMIVASTGFFEKAQEKSVDVPFVSDGVMVVEQSHLPDDMWVKLMDGCITHVNGKNVTLRSDIAKYAPVDMLNRVIDNREVNQ